MIVIAGTARANITDWDEARREMQRMSAASEAEPGCIRYRFYLNPNDAGEVFIFEEWESEAALTAHFQTPHMAAFNAFMAKAGAGEMAIKRYEVAAVEEL